MNNNKQKIFKAFATVFLLLCCAIVLYPVVYTVSVAFSPKRTYAGADLMPFSDGFSLNQYYILFEDNFVDWVMNTLIIAICVMILTVICCTLAASSDFPFIRRYESYVRYYNAYWCL